MKILGIIPSRFESTRLPGKPLLSIQGKTMIQRVYEQCQKTTCLSDIIVATDDKRILEEVHRFGGKAMLTSKSHQSGTDRCAEVALNVENKYDFIINIQGDEPFIQPEQIDALASILTEKTQLATLIKKIEKTEELFDKNKPKVILRKDKTAIYFSRKTIPFQRGIEEKEWLKKHIYFKHIGIYAYHYNILKEITKLKPSSLELAESLEQLRWIENGYTIQTKETTIETFGIDTQEDLEKARVHRIH